MLAATFSTKSVPSGLQHHPASVCRLDMAHCYSLPSPGWALGSPCALCVSSTDSLHCAPLFLSDASHLPRDSLTHCWHQAPLLPSPQNSPFNRPSTAHLNATTSPQTTQLPTLLPSASPFLISPSDSFSSEYRVWPSTSFSSICLTPTFYPGLIFWGELLCLNLQHTFFSLGRLKIS